MAATELCRRTTAVTTCLLIALLTAPLAAAVNGRYVRVENPTGPGMEWVEIEVWSGQTNVVLKKPELFSGTGSTPERPFHRHLAPRLVDGNTDTSQRGPGMSTANEAILNPWFEIDLGKVTKIDRIVLHGSRIGTKLYLDKGHRVVSVLDAGRRVVWVDKFNYYDRQAKGVFTLTPGPVKDRSLLGRHVPPEADEWFSPVWVLDVGPERRPPDAARRLARFAQRRSPQQVEAFARRFFSLVADDVPELAPAFDQHRRGDHQAALDTWKRYWFSKMRRVNTRSAYDERPFTYAREGDDLLEGVRLTVGLHSIRASRFTPGCIYWVDLPDPRDNGALNAALIDTAELALVNKFGRGLIRAYARTGDARYLQRWSEIMDDWSLNFFADADATPHNVTDLFVMHPANHWGVMMEELADLAERRPELIELIPADTLARVQLTCLERYAPAYWRVGRRTVFNHNTSGLATWGRLLDYIDEFRAGRRVAREWRQHLERWMTQGTMPDGSMVEVGDEGHFSIPMILGINFARLDADQPEWYTPGWRGRAQVYFDNLHKYVFRHLAPGGWNHRYDNRYSWERLVNLVDPYRRDANKRLDMWDASERIYAIPEVRRILDTVCGVSAGRPQVAADAPWWMKRAAEPFQAAHDAAARILGSDRPGEPAINSDWMPYTGSYYFRGGWKPTDRFLAMLAPGAHGGSDPQAASWGQIYTFDFKYPLLRAYMPTIDGQPPKLIRDVSSYMPGSKTSNLTYADRTPAPNRWHASKHFDYGETVFRGTYQSVGYNYQAHQPVIDSTAIEQVETARRVFHLRSQGLFVVVDAVHHGDTAQRGREHRYASTYTLSLSTEKDSPSRPFSIQRQLVWDDSGKRVMTDNPDGPNVTLYQFGALPLSYRLGREAKPDFGRYAPRLGDWIGIANQELRAEWRGAGDQVLVSLISSRDRNAPDRVESAQPINTGPDVAGFRARVAADEVFVQSSAHGPKALACGELRATAESLLVVRQSDGTVRALVLGGEKLAAGGRDIPLPAADCELELSPALELRHAQAIYRPIDPVRFLPERNAFEDRLVVEMISDTPGVQIRYTTDGTPPTLRSTLYTGPITITESTEFAARAWRIGPDGRPLEHDEFEINGTRFTEPTWAWFYKVTPRPPQAVAESALRPGLRYEMVDGTSWYDLFSHLHWLAPTRTGIVPRELDLSMAKTNDCYGVRYKGFIRVPEDGLYTFHAPRRFVYADNAASYDLRLYIDGEEWYLTQWWHGLGTWSVSLKKGLHAFQVDFADARTRPWRPSGLWRNYPRPWVIPQGPPGDILLSTPGMEPQRIPAEWLFHTPPQ